MKQFKIWIELSWFKCGKILWINLFPFRMDKIESNLIWSFGWTKVNNSSTFFASLPKDLNLFFSFGQAGTGSRVLQSLD